MVVTRTIQRKPYADTQWRRAPKWSKPRDPNRLQYQRTTVELDVKYNGIAKGKRGGPCNRHLESMGLVRQIVVGRFGEVSKHTMIIVKHCADMIASNNAGYNTEDNAIGHASKTTSRRDCQSLAYVVWQCCWETDLTEGKQQKRS